MDFDGIKIAPNPNFKGEPIDMRQRPPFEIYYKAYSLEIEDQVTLNQRLIEWQREIDEFFRISMSEPVGMKSLLSEYYNEKIYSVRTQEEYDAVSNHFYEMLIWTQKLTMYARSYCRCLGDRIKALESTPDSRCPCCGELLSRDFIKSLKEELQAAKTQADYYDNFQKARESDIEKLKERAKILNLQVRGWVYRMEKAYKEMRRNTA